MMRIFSFRMKMAILNVIQSLFLSAGAYIRPARAPAMDFISSFLSAKPCGFDMEMIGDGSDGTYVLPNDLDGIEMCFSPGVGPSSQFEEAIFDAYGIRSFLIDASVPSVPTDRDDFFVFDRKFLGASTYGDFIDLETWVMQHASDEIGKDLLLQMDIEGAEFSALLACPKDILKRFRIIALEVHFLDAMNLEFFASTVEQTFRKLDEIFVVCYARANDCCGSLRVGSKSFPRVAEVTLIRRDRVVLGNSVERREFVIRNL